MNRKQFLLFVTLLFVITNCDYAITTTQPVSVLPNESCIDSFDTFAYTIPKLINTPQKTTLPMSPWQTEVNLPEHSESGLFQTELTRTFDNHLQIWLKKTPFTHYIDNIKEPYLYLIYQPDNREWKRISAQVDNSDAFVDQLFLGKDGTIWGRNIWSFSKVDADYPVLSRYNEEKGRFEFVQSTESIPHGWLHNLSSQNFPSWDKVYLDEQGLFWVFVSRDAIYSFSPLSEVVTRYADVSKYQNIGLVALSLDGNLYFTQQVLTQTFVLGRILKFNPTNKEIEPLNLPEETWLDPSSILVDHSGNLWLNAFGWREPDGEWTLLQPNMREFVRSFDNQDLWTVYYPPSILMESSDGRLWFELIKSSERQNLRTGMAWFDPATRTGCWFTSESSNIVEDIHQQLWMVIDNHLYTYSLQRQ